MPKQNDNHPWKRNFKYRRKCKTPGCMRSASVGYELCVSCSPAHITAPLPKRKDLPKRYNPTVDRATITATAFVDMSPLDSKPKQQTITFDIVRDDRGIIDIQATISQVASKSTNVRKSEG